VRTPSLTVEGEMGRLAVEISGSPPSSFKSALRQQLEPLLSDGNSGKALSGRTLRVEVGAPEAFETSQDGVTGFSCRLVAESRLMGQGSPVDLSPAEGVRSHALRGAACSAAASDLAEEVVIQLVRAF
jgi:hypothetical protein